MNETACEIYCKKMVLANLKHSFLLLLYFIEIIYDNISWKCSIFYLTIGRIVLIIIVGKELTFFLKNFKIFKLTKTKLLLFYFVLIEFFWKIRLNLLINNVLWSTVKCCCRTVFFFLVVLCSNEIFFTAPVFRCSKIIIHLLKLIKLICKLRKCRMHKIYVNVPNNNCFSLRIWFVLLLLLFLVYLRQTAI